MLVAETQKVESFVVLEGKLGTIHSLNSEETFY